MSIWDPSDWYSEVHDQELPSEYLHELGLVLREWAEEHPLADQPLLYVASTAPDQSDHIITPRDIANAVSNEESRLREPVLRLFSVGLSGYSGGVREAIGQVIEALRDDIRDWRLQYG
ncbi:hypothetical protein Sgleb_60120 [Streptomyces glebosus]|uniref:Uncharacterized protein n=1 Tax=Streptomyces glebosus TaxID=249580 RepID=A0A640T8I4_9ACTN|nr:hypothetical protein [Streptomyces glebosus]GFE17965.1 hypothetical protein Sgleb_60120 [Streptomyces glebosus]GHG46849.1 hypothetical protein GCM10010513_02880 [Streptomyces glebosus]